MKRLALSLCLAAAALSACATPGSTATQAAASTAAVVADATLSTKPVDIANRTTLDERLATGATVGYTAASRLGTALATAGIIDKVRFKKLDDDGYVAVLAVKAAYDAGNAASYTAALARVNAAVAGINALVK